MWSFNRDRDNLKIPKEKIHWKGPFSLPKYEKETGLNSIPDLSGVYLFCFEFEDGYLLYGAGISKSIRKRMLAHIREYKKGNYTVFNTDNAKKGIRDEIWHGWKYARENRNEFEHNKETILRYVEKQLIAFNIFIGEISEKRKRERIEDAIMQGIYNSKEKWSELADRGMFLKGRFNSEMPIEITNITSEKIYGLPDKMEI